MRLTELEARFIKLNIGPADQYFPHGRPSHGHVDLLAQADGVFFLCPKCFKENSGPVGTHGVICWFKGRVPDWVDPSPGRWNPSGSGINDLTFVPPGAVSVLLTSGCNWHGFVRSGDAE